MDPRNLRQPWMLFIRRLVTRSTLLLTWLFGERKSVSARVRFHIGDFGEALLQAESHLERKASDTRMRILAVCCAIEKGDFECARKHMRLVNDDRIPVGKGEVDDYPEWRMPVY